MLLAATFAVLSTDNVFVSRSTPTKVSSSLQPIFASLSFLLRIEGNKEKRKKRAKESWGNARYNRRVSSEMYRTILSQSPHKSVAEITSTYDKQRSHTLGRESHEISTELRERRKRLYSSRSGLVMILCFGESSEGLRTLRGWWRCYGLTPHHVFASRAKGGKRECARKYEDEGRQGRGA